MTRADKILILVIMLCSAVLMVFVVGNAPEPAAASVKVNNKEEMRIDLAQNGTYKVKGTLGDVNIEVKDKAVRVTQENSPHHYCSKQGFVSDPNTPIVCLPNHTVITIEGEDSSEDVVIQ